jgi:16S rRNA (uracil1498-N3)-methyltransferase
VIGHFFVAPEQVDEGLTAQLDAEQTHHLVTVLRARTGDALTVADGSGTVWTGRFQGVDEGLARVALDEATVHPPPSPAITVVHALPKQRKLDEVIQRLTELGVDCIVPVHSARSQVELDERKAAKALVRWRSVALAAAKQSRRPRLPRIEPVGDWTTAFRPGMTGVVCWEESRVGLRAALDRVGPAENLVVAIGPEGGLTTEEVLATGLVAGSLGPAVLRTETAALVAVAAVRYHYDLMEPAG